MKVYVFKDHTGFRITIRKPAPKASGVKELDIPENAGYLLLTTQASSDALQDSLETMFKRNGDHFLRWGYDPDEARWEGEGGPDGQ